MIGLARKLWQRGRGLFPLEGFNFDRPLVLLQSDDWGRVGLRDQAGLEQLQSNGLTLGERSYDFYTLEQADDLSALTELLLRHRDSSGRSPCLVMNFIVANVDFAATKKNNFKEIIFLPLADGLPEGWARPGLLEAYRQGIADGVFYPSLHGHSHFCRPAVRRYLQDSGERGQLLRTLWDAGTPHIYWRMPWIGYEYWDGELSPDERFLDESEQAKSIKRSTELFVDVFSRRAFSACAPGYRANSDTYQAWLQQGIRVVQNGPRMRTPPYWERGMLNLCRTMDFEPSIGLSLEECLLAAEENFSRGIPVIVSVHSINFHSSIRNFRDPTLKALDQLLSMLEARHPDLLYLHDADLNSLVNSGTYESPQGKMNVGVRKIRFTNYGIETGSKSE